MPLMLLKLGLEVEEADSKALANFLFREIIEDAHAKYKIPDSEIKKMCKQAVNRAKYHIERIAKGDDVSKFAFRYVACFSKEWDNPEITVDIAENESLQLECEQIIIDAIKEYEEKEDDKDDSV